MPTRKCATAKAADIRDAVSRFDRFPTPAARRLYHKQLGISTKPGQFHRNFIYCRKLFTHNKLHKRVACCLRQMKPQLNGLNALYGAPVLGPFKACVLAPLNRQAEAVVAALDTARTEGGGLAGFQGGSIMSRATTQARPAA